MGHVGLNTSLGEHNYTPTPGGATYQAEPAYLTAEEAAFFQPGATLASTGDGTMLAAQRGVDVLNPRPIRGSGGIAGTPNTVQQPPSTFLTPGQATRPVYPQATIPDDFAPRGFTDEADLLRLRPGEYDKYVTFFPGTNVGRDYWSVGVTEGFIVGDGSPAYLNGVFWNPPNGSSYVTAALNGANFYTNRTVPGVISANIDPGLAYPRNYPNSDLSRMTPTRTA